MSFFNFCCCIFDQKDEPPERITMRQKKASELSENEQKQLKYSLSSQKTRKQRKERKQNLLIKQGLQIKIVSNNPIVQYNSLKIQQNKAQKYQNQQADRYQQNIHQSHRSNQQQIEINIKKSSGFIIKEQSAQKEDCQKSYQNRNYQKILQKSKKRVVNNRLDNFWKQQINKQDYFPLDQGIQKQGLPNMGNTCYLNSLIQLLFAAERLVMIVQSISQNNHNSFHYRLSKVFRSIKQHSKIFIKKKCLKAVISDIKKYQSSFKPHQQNDSLQCLLTVLNILEDEDNNSSKMNYFKLRYSLICKCKDNQNLILQSLYISSKQKCLLCKEDFGIIIHSSAIYLLMIPDQRLIQKMCINNVKGENLIYQCKAFVSYFGDQLSGHYIAHRKQNNKTWICLNDSKVIVNQNVKNLNYTPKYCLYQFIKKDNYKPSQKC